MVSVRAMNGERRKRARVDALLGRPATALVIAALMACGGASAQTVPNATPKTFDEAHQLFSHHRGALEEALKAAFRAKCLDQKAIDTISAAETGIAGIKKWMALLQHWPFFAPIPPVTEPVASPGELKGRIAWAQFMVGRLAFHIRHLRTQKPCEGVTDKPPADKTAATPDANPGCEYKSEEAKTALELGEVQDTMMGLLDEREGHQLKIENANEIRSKARYYRDNPAEKPADFNIAAQEADAKAVKARAELDLERINAQLSALAKREQGLRDKLEGLLCREPTPAVDRCLIGKWRSEPITVVAEKTSGGDGIVLTIAADGVLTIDYTGMKPVPAGPFGPTSNQWQGTAAGIIETKDGAIRIKSVEKSEITWKFTDGQGKVTTRKLTGLGPAAPGNNPADAGYACTETTLTYKNPAESFTFKRVQ